jgi:hypothetical protein
VFVVQASRLLEKKRRQDACTTTAAAIFSYALARRCRIKSSFMRWLVLFLQEV